MEETNQEEKIVMIMDEPVNLKEFLEAHKHLKKRKAKRAPKIEQLFQITSELEIDQLENIDIVGLQEFRLELEDVPDIRDQSWVLHKLSDILVIVLLAVLANCDTYNEIEIFARAHIEWLKKFLSLEHGVPTDDTYRIVLSCIDMNYVYEVIIGLLMKRINNAIAEYGSTELTEPDIIAGDGKVSQSSGRKDAFENPGQKPLDTMNLYSNDWGMCLTQEFIETKSNEIPAMPVALSKIDITGAIVTCDALNTQTKTAEAVVSGGGNYVMAVKGCKKTLYGDLKEYFDEERRLKIRLDPSDFQTYTRTEEKEQDTIVIREYYLSTDVNWLYKSEEWPNLTAMGLCRKTIISFDINKPISGECRYYICGGVDKIENFERSVRLHWGVENGLHWQLDYTFKDDANKTTPENGAEALQLFKKAALAILKVAKIVCPPQYRSLKSIRFELSQAFEKTIGKIFSVLNIDSLIEANLNKLIKSQN